MALPGLFVLGFLLTVGCDSTIEPVGRGLDRTPPEVSQTLPVADAQGVPIDTTITVTFNETMDPATVHPGTYRVSVLGQPLNGIVVGDGEARRFVFVPSADTLPGNRWIDVELRDVADLSGNRIAAQYQFSFRTLGTNPLPPRVPAHPYPADGENGVPIDTTFTWEGGSDSGEDVTYDFWLGTDVGSLELRASDLDSASYRPGPLAYETLHFWKVIARSAGGETQGPVWRTTTTDNPDPTNRPPRQPCSPDPPSGALAVPVDVSLDWSCTSDPDGDSVIFDVYLGPSTDPPLLDSVSGPPYSPPAPLAPGTFYGWRVVARDGRGGVTSSPLWQFHTSMPPPPNDPPTPPAEPITPSDRGTSEDIDVELTWSGGDDPDEDPVTYLVRFGLTNPPPDREVVTVKSLEITELEHDTRYYWQIVARDDHEHQVSGPVWRFRTPVEPPPPNEPPDSPRDPSPASGGEATVLVTLTWSGGDDPDGDQVEYVVFLEEGDLADPDSVATVNEKSYSTTLDYPGTYFWRIEARDGRGGVGSGPVWFFTTNGPPTAPCNPTPADGAEGVSTIVMLRWQCGSDPEERPVEFEIRLGRSPNPPFFRRTSDREFLIVVDFDTTYYWRIIARDDLGNETAGPVWSFTTRGVDG